MLARLRRRLGHRSGPIVRRGPGLQAEITLRLAKSDDRDRIAHLAALYSAREPRGPLLLAEVDRELHAALTLAGDQELLDPFVPSAALVELLALRARQLRDQMPTDAGTPDLTASEAVAICEPPVP